MVFGGGDGMLCSCPPRSVTKFSVAIGVSNGPPVVQGWDQSDRAGLPFGEGPTSAGVETIFGRPFAFSWPCCVFLLLPLRHTASYDHCCPPEGLPIMWGRSLQPLNKNTRDENHLYAGIVVRHSHQRHTSPSSDPPPKHEHHRNIICAQVHICTCRLATSDIINLSV